MQDPYEVDTVSEQTSNTLELNSLQKCLKFYLHSTVIGDSHEHHLSRKPLNGLFINSK